MLVLAHLTAHVTHLACMQVLLNHQYSDISNRKSVSSDCPELLSHPSITYVSLTGETENLLGDAAETDGHRFLLLQVDGKVRVLQACKGITMLHCN